MFARRKVTKVIKMHPEGKRESQRQTSDLKSTYYILIYFNYTKCATLHATANYLTQKENKMCFLKLLFLFWCFRHHLQLQSHLIYALQYGKILISPLFQCKHLCCNNCCHVIFSVNQLKSSVKIFVKIFLTSHTSINWLIL